MLNNIRDITLKSAWNYRSEVFHRCAENNACKEEFDKLKKAIQELNEEEYLNILRDNFSWCVKYEILNYPFNFSYRLCEGIARVIIFGKHGYYNVDDDEYLIKPQFDYCLNFHNGFARVCIDGKWGFIKEDGDYLIEPKFDYCAVFHNGSAKVEIGTDYKYINTKGEYI